MRTVHLTLCAMLGAMMALAACRDSSAEPAHRPPAVPGASTKPGAPPSAASADNRTALPLTEMMAAHQKRDMRDHLRVVQEITAALGSDDFDALVRSAARIGWSEQQAAKCKHMGAGAPGFAAMGEYFHKTAERISVAARGRDRPGVIRALDDTLQVCVSCHESYRQEIVTDAKRGTANME